VRLLACVLVVSLAGCSFALVQGPRAQTPSAPPPPECTDSYALPVIDFILSVATTGGSISAFEQSEDSRGIFTIGLLSGALAATTLASGIYGVVQVRRCTRAPHGLPEPDDILKLRRH